MDDKYRMLIMGKNDDFIDLLFRELSDEYYMLCSSSRYDDQINHLKELDPHLCVIAVSDENYEEIKAYTNLKRKLTSMDVLTVVIGEETKVGEFVSIASQVADVVINNTDISEIREVLSNEIKRAEKEYYEQQIMRQKLEGIKNTLGKKHVLVIDDDPLMLKLIKEYLGESYNVATAVSGKVAQKFLESKDTNLIFLDYEMPEENGVEVLKKIRENEKHAEIPVVFLTGVSDKSKLVEALAMKPQGYLLKPIDREKLLGTVEKFIG